MRRFTRRYYKPGEPGFGRALSDVRVREAFDALQAKDPLEGLRRVGRIAGLVAAFRHGWHGDSKRGRSIWAHKGAKVTRLHRYGEPRDAKGRFVKWPDEMRIRKPGSQGR